MIVNLLVMKSRIPVVIPTQKTKFDEVEIERLKVTARNNPDFIFVIPKANFRSFNPCGLSPSDVIVFDDYWFKSRSSYNAFLLNELFWETFLSFEKIVICQVDAILIKSVDDLLNCSSPYVGSRWLPAKKCRIIQGKIYEDYKKHFFLPYTEIAVGNGGLSLRSPEIMLFVLNQLKLQGRYRELSSGDYNEDIVFSLFLKLLGFEMPEKDTVDSIFLERASIGLRYIPNVYGFHALEKFNPELQRLILKS